MRRWRGVGSTPTLLVNTGAGKVVPALRDTTAAPPAAASTGWVCNRNSDRTGHLWIFLGTQRYTRRLDGAILNFLDCGFSDGVLGICYGIGSWVWGGTGTVALGLLHDGESLGGESA